MVGVQVAREAVRELHPMRIVISSLTQREVDEAVAILRAETRDVDFALRESGDDDPLRLQLANRFASDLHADHARSAEDEDG